MARHQLLCLILFSSFVARLFLAGWKSYWYDEILSVAIYGANHATLASALKALAGHSAHPPLYHVVLFYWMKLFGTAEVTTRTLSNLYIAGATLCLYLLAERLYGRRVAIASTLLFAFSYTATFFGLEDRSYAQSLFLVTLSSLLLLRWLDRVGDFAGWRDMLAARAVPLLLCNIALLLTHYSNALFVIVQALFVAFFFGHSSRSATRLKSLGMVAGFYASQFAVALAIWGPVALATRERFAAREEFVVHGHLPGHGPLKIFTDSVVGLFDLPALVALAVLVLLAMVLIQSARRHFMRAGKAPPLNQYFLFYLTAWAILSCFLTYLIFFASGWERYTARYFAFCVPAFSILLVLALEQLVKSLEPVSRKFGFSARRVYLRNATLFAVIACALLALPGAYKAAKDPKGLYRDIARSIVTLVQRDPDSGFAIYEVALRRRPMLNYYLERFSKRLRVKGTYLATDESDRDALPRIEAKTAKRDYVIFAFPYVKASNFPVLMQWLDSKHDVIFSQLAPNGRGYVVLKTPRSKSGDKTGGE